MFGRRDRERELDEELRGHLAMAERDRIERGERPDDAAAAARREFGNVGLVREVTREMWRGLWFERLIQDVRYAGRVLRRSPVFSIVALVSLAVGIGATTALFSIVNAVRLRTLPVPRSSELVEITPVTLDGARGNFNSWRPSLTNPVWERVRDTQRAFRGTLAFGGATFNLATGGESRPANGLIVSGSYFDVLEIRPELGRLFTAADDRHGCPLRAVISDSFWERQFGRSAAAVGATLQLDSHPAEIVGVTPASFFGLEVGRRFDVAIPICADPILAGGAGRLDSGTDWWLIVMGRLKPGTTIAQASADLKALSPAIFRDTLKPNYPAGSVPTYLAMTLHALPASTGISYVREVYDDALGVLLALAAAVLLIACANIASLVLARARAREREIAIRLGLGASRGRVVRQLVTESAVLTAAGALAGFAAARTLSEALVAFVDGGEHEIVLDLAADWRVGLFTVALGALACVLFGLMPALRSTRPGVASLVRTSRRMTAGARESTALRRALVVMQMAVSLLLVVGALLFMGTLRNLLRVDTGFTRSGIVMAGMDLRQATVPADARTRFKQDILDRLRGTPGIEAAGTTLLTPASGDAWGNEATLDPGSGAARMSTLLDRVSDGYFATFRIPIVAGRDFDPRLDTAAAPPVAIVNQTFARKFGQGNAVGRRFTIEATPQQPATEYQVIGVSADAKYLGLREDVSPVAYFPMSQDPRPSRWALVAIRSQLPTAALRAAVVQSMRDLDPRIDISFTVLDSFIARTLVRERLMATLSTFFGSIAAALAVVGLYGLIAYTVARRTGEFGIRMALGATRGRIISAVLREAAPLVAAGLTLGLLLALSTTTFARSLLFRMEPTDPLSIAGALLLLGVIGMAAAYLPALSAARIEPTQALRID
jgi:putative ABC transport system permease protein